MNKFIIVGIGILIACIIAAIFYYFGPNPQPEVIIIDVNETEIINETKPIPPPPKPPVIEPNTTDPVEPNDTEPINPNFTHNFSEVTPLDN